jgi:hypothetical protein
LAFGLSSRRSAPKEDNTQAHSELLQSCDNVAVVKQAEAIKSDFQGTFNNIVNAFFAGANDGLTAKPDKDTPICMHCRDSLVLNLKNPSDIGTILRKPTFGIF